MRFLFYLLVLFFLLLTACNKKADHTDLNYIFKRYSQLNQEHSALDQQYSLYFSKLCDSEGTVKFDNADNIFNAINNWKIERKKIDVKYSDVIFDKNQLLIKEFKDQYIIDELIKLTSNFKAIENSVDYSFLETPDCQIKYIKSNSDYKAPVKTRTCLISCKKIQQLAKSIQDISTKERIIIKKSFVALEQKRGNN